MKRHSHCSEFPSTPTHTLQRRRAHTPKTLVSELLALAVLALALASCEASGSCESGFVKVWLATYGKHLCFRLTPITTWAGAVAKCQEYGAKLAIWESEQGAQAMQALMVTPAFKQAHTQRSVADMFDTMARMPYQHYYWTGFMFNGHAAIPFGWYVCFGS